MTISISDMKSNSRSMLAAEQRVDDALWPIVYLFCSLLHVCLGYNTSQSNAVDQADGSTSQDLSKVSEEAVDRFPGPGGQVSSGLYGYPMPIIESVKDTLDLRNRRQLYMYLNIFVSYLALWLQDCTNRVWEKNTVWLSIM